MELELADVEHKDRLLQAKAQLTERERRLASLLYTTERYGVAYGHLPATSLPLLYCLLAKCLNDPENRRVVRLALETT